ncbi:hypothetical protein QFC22_006155 [Naganishia vaughanmartiniae]|uniref:Uncharacterized protein n=1 Tax=Naganishia vaughanmartiniae TaxID=1424756 RepID=A0ACC2WPC9_9TREE|nr:hypothetical protein QFC22_006155 [Naganishia vaughanmartiniae]
MALSPTDPLNRDLATYEIADIRAPDFAGLETDGQCLSAGEGEVLETENELPPMAIRFETLGVSSPRKASVTVAQKEVNIATSEILSPRLPAELLLTIAEHLAGANAYNTLASLSAMCFGIRQIVIPILLETVVFDSPEYMSKYIEVSDVYQLLKKKGRHTSQLRISGTVCMSTLNELMKIPVIRTSESDDTATPLQPIKKIPIVTVTQHGRIMNDFSPAEMSTTPFSHVSLGMKFVFEHRNAAEGLRDTMMCLYRWIPSSDQVKEYKGNRDMPCRTLVVGLPKCDGMVYDVLIESFKYLLPNRHDMVVRAEVKSRGLLTVSHLKRSIPHLADLYGKHWQGFFRARKGVEERKMPLEIEIAEPRDAESGRKEVIYYLTFLETSQHSTGIAGLKHIAVTIKTSLLFPYLRIQQVLAGHTAAIFICTLTHEQNDLTLIDSHNNLHQHHLLLHRKVSSLINALHIFSTSKMSSKRDQRDLELAVALAERRSAGKIKTLEKELEESRESKRKLQIDLNIVIAEKVDMGTALFGPPVLPLELLVAVGEFLAGSDDYGTLADLSATCHAVRTEMMCVLCETVILLEGDLTIAKTANGSYLIREFLAEHRRYIRYMIVDKNCRRLIPAHLSNLAVEIYCDRVAYPDIYRAQRLFFPTTSAIISATVFSSTLEHLVRLSLERRTRDGQLLRPYPMVVEIERLEVLTLGRIVIRNEDPVAEPEWWTFSDDATLKFVNAEGSREEMQETMQYLLKRFPEFDSVYDYEQIQPRILLLGNISLLDIFIDSLSLLKCKVSMDSIVEIIPALITVYIENWSCVKETVCYWIDNIPNEEDPYSLLEINVVHDFFAVHPHDVSLRLAVTLSAGAGVTFALSHNDGTILYRQTDLSLSDSFEEDEEDDWE